MLDLVKNAALMCYNYRTRRAKAIFLRVKMALQGYQDGVYTRTH